MICSSCKKAKHNLSPHKSSLLPTSLLLCNSCIEAKFEPRHIIILVGRTKGAEHVREYIIQRRYIGEEITARELTV
jgi:hypothetical protein